MPFLHIQHASGERGSSQYRSQGQCRRLEGADYSVGVRIDTDLSTLLRQYVKRNYQIGDRRALYCSADSFDFSSLSLVELAEQFFINGWELLIVDEIHKYKPGRSDWSRDVKEIYELFPKLKFIVSGASLQGISCKRLLSFPA